MVKREKALDSAIGAVSATRSITRRVQHPAQRVDVMECGGSGRLWSTVVELDGNAWAAMLRPDMPGVGRSRSVLRWKRKRYIDVKEKA
jgi:hypothetical protein